MPHILSSSGRPLVLALALAANVVAGCGDQNGRSNTSARNGVSQTSNTAATQVARVLAKDYDPHTETVRLQVQRAGTVAPAPRPAGIGQVEDVIDPADHSGVINYATSSFPDKTVRRIIMIYEPGGPRRAPAATAATPQPPQQYVVPNDSWVSFHSEPSINSAVLGRLQKSDKAPLVRKVNQWWYEINWQNQNVYITTNPQYTRIVTDPTGTSGAGASAIQVPDAFIHPTPPTAATESQANLGAASPSTARVPIPPPGVSIDKSIRPVAGTDASLAAKTDAVLSVARSKLGTPYVWGHNEDEGQVGFDCSNFVEYVYHHALGYHFTTSSRKQYQTVGVTIPQSQMQPGDLLIFNQGGHVGIYAGNGQMIEEGGGLGKVGYLSVQPGSYWRNHLSAVRRMY
jgi:cell wall-associated NlpC family hydrolase